MIDERISHLGIHTNEAATEQLFTLIKWWRMMMWWTWSLYFVFCLYLCLCCIVSVSLPNFRWIKIYILWMDHVFCVRYPITGTVLPMRNDRASVGKILLGLTISTNVAEIVSQSNPVRSGSQINRWKEANVILVPEVYPARSITSDLRPIADCDARGRF